MESIDFLFPLIIGIILGGVLFSKDFRKGMSKFFARSGRNLYQIGKDKKDKK